MRPEVPTAGQPGRDAPIVPAVIVAALGAVAAVGIRGLMQPWVHEQIPYITLYPIIIGVTLWGGWIPGAVALIVGAVLAGWMYIDWANDTIPGIVSSALVILLGATLVALGNYQRCAAQRWQEAAADARRAAEASAESEARYRAMIELCPDAVVVYKDEQIVFSNPAANRLFGVSTLVGLNAFDTAHPSMRPLFRQRMAQMLHNPGEPAPIIEGQWLRADGGIIEGEVTSVAVPWEGGLAVQVMGRDITDRKRAERALRESEARFRAVAEDIPDIIFTFQPGGPCDFVNRRFTEITGIPQAEALGYGWTRSLHPEDTERAKREWLAARERGQPYEFRYRYRVAEGHHRWFMGRARPIKGDDGRIIQWYGTITDVDSMVRFEEHLQRRASDLAESNTDLEEFAQVVAHDLKEPLRGIATCAASVAEDYRGQLDQEGHDRLETLVRLPRRMYQQLDALLEFSRVGKTRMATAETDIEHLVRQVAEELDHWIREHNGSVQIIRPLPNLRCDPIRVEQLLRNLIVNGIKYNTSNPRIVEIGADAERSPPSVFVRDNGIGIPARHHETIFNMFRRLHTREAYGGGAGAGLAIVKRIVERHGGRIWLQSEVGKGTTIHFTLAPDPVPAPPLVPAELDSRAEPPIIEVPPANRAPRPG